MVVAVFELDRCRVAGHCPNLLGKNVGVTGVAGGLCDEAKEDKAKAHRADDAVVGGVVEGVSVGDVAGCHASCPVFGHDVIEGLVVAYLEAGVTANGLAGALLEGPAGEGPLKPNAFCCSAMLN